MAPVPARLVFEASRAQPDNGALFCRLSAKVAAGRVIVVQLNMLRLRNSSATAVCLVLIMLTAAVLLLGNNAPLQAATPAGTQIENQATLEYEGGYVTSNVVSITVAQVAGLSLSPTSASLNGIPTEAVCLPVTLTNTGNGTDAFDLAVSSQLNWPTAIYRDDNADGIRQLTEQTVISSTGNLGMEQTFRFFAVTNIPAGTASGTTDTITVTAYSNFNTSVSASTNCFVQVAQGAGISLNPTQALVTAATSSKAYIAFTISNIGNAADNVSLSASGNLGWPTAIVADANKDGIHQENEITVINSTGNLPSGGQSYAFVEVQVPANLVEDTQANISLAATSTLDPSKTAQGSYTVLGTVPPAGDVDGDGSITSSDMEAIAQMAIGAGSWTEDQYALADVNGDYNINVLDLSGLSGSSSQQSTQSTSATGRQLTLPITNVSAGFLEDISINIDDGAQVAGFQATVLFESSLLSILEVNIGPLMEASPDWEINYVIDGNEIRLIAYNTAGGSLASGAGGILDIAAFVSGNAQPGNELDLIWSEALLCTASGEAILPLEALNGLLSVALPGDLLVQVYRDADTAPIAGAQVEAWMDGNLIASATTDNAGNCYLSALPSGSYDVHVSASGFYGETMPEVIVATGETAATGLGLIALQQNNTGAIEGILLNKMGEPLCDSNITIYQEGKRITSLLTDRAGYYLCSALSPGDYTITVKSKGYIKEIATVTVYANEMTFADFLLVYSNPNWRL